MIIETLKLKDFRNYEELTLQPHPGVNILFGQNGSGKTNLLEGIHYCALGRSHRTSVDREVVRKGAAMGACGIQLVKSGIHYDVAVKLTPAMTAYILEPNRPASSCLRISLMAAKGNFWRILCHSIILAIPLMIATGLCNLLFRDGGLLHTIALALCTALCEGYMTLGTLGLSIHLLQNRE